MNLEEANYFTAFLGGALSSVGAYIICIDRKNLFLTLIGIIIIIFSWYYLVFGVNFIKNREENSGIKAFYFPSNPEDVKAFLRGVVWFITCAIILVISDYIKRNYLNVQ